jgi:hypothetical protein
MLEDADVFSIGPCSFRFALGMEEKEEAPEPPPNILRSASYQAVEGPAPAQSAPYQPFEGPAPVQSAPYQAVEGPTQPIADILKSHLSSENGHEAEESPQEGPPQAAAAP